MITEKIPHGFQQGWLPCPCGKTHPIPTAETMKSFQDSQTRVPWGKDDKGQDVYTNGIMEDAFGLTPWINGWGGDHGYYVDPGHKAQVAAQIVGSIDWQRVREMDQFTTPFNQGDAGWMMFGEQLLLPHGRWVGLLRKCFKIVPREEFDKAVSAAWAERKKRSKKYLVTARWDGRKNGRILRKQVEAINSHDAKNIAFGIWTYKEKQKVGWTERMTARRIGK